MPGLCGQLLRQRADLAGEVSRFWPKDAMDAPPVRRLDSAAMAVSAAAFWDAEFCGRPARAGQQGISGWATGCTDKHQMRWLPAAVGSSTAQTAVLRQTSRWRFIHVKYGEAGLQLLPRMAKYNME